MSGYSVLLRMDVVGRNAHESTICVEKRVTLPFLPRVEDMLGFGAGGDFVEVDQVFYTPSTNDIEVWCSSQGDEPHFTRLLLTEGWSEVGEAV